MDRAVVDDRKPGSQLTNALPGCVTPATVRVAQNGVTDPFGADEGRGSAGVCHPGDGVQGAKMGHRPLWSVRGKRSAGVSHPGGGVRGAKRGHRPLWSRRG